MGRRIAIAVFVDACGWGVVEPRDWFLPELIHRRSVKSLFGFSSACVPAILTGRRPNDNDHWSTFFYSPNTSPFRHLRHLRLLPSALFDRGRVRRYLSKAIAAAYGYTGYFQMYNLPFEVLPYYDYAEKKDVFLPGGINRGTSIFDDLARQRTPHHVSDWRRPEKVNIRGLRRALVEGGISFGFLYAAALDSLMHAHTKDSVATDEKLRWYQEEFRELLRVAATHYDEVRFALFSDHGMATVTRVVDLAPAVEATGLRFGEDYASILDSTMLRFWFLRPYSETRVRSALSDGETGRWVTDDELVGYGTYWPDGKFGHAIYALEPGVVLNPSHMGRVAPRGMHGYRPEHADSDAALLANFEPETPVGDITDLYRVMQEMARWAAEPPSCRSG